MGVGIEDHVEPLPVNREQHWTQTITLGCSNGGGEGETFLSRQSGLKRSGGEQETYHAYF